MKQRSAATVLWGVTLVSIGGLLLARNMGYDIPIWSAIVRYWPLLIIAWGMLKLIDYFRFRNSPNNRPLFSGGEVALLVFIIFAGSAITIGANMSPGIAGFFKFTDDFDFWDITGNNYTFTEHHDMAVPAGSTIEILNMYGSVDVRPSDGDRIVLDVTKTVRASDQNEANRLEKEFIFSIHTDGSVIRVISNRDDPSRAAQDSPAGNTAENNSSLENGTRIETRIEERIEARIEERFGGQRQRFRSDLVLQVPRQASVRIQNRNGSVQVVDLTGDQTINNRYSSVTVRRITGSLQVENRNGMVLIEDVSAAVKVQNSFDRTTASKIGGSLEIVNRNGPVQVDDVKGKVNVSNAFDRIEVRDAHADVEISGRNSAVEVQRIDGKLTLETTFEDVGIHEVKGAIDVKNRNGDVHLTFQQPPQSDVSVSSEFSDVYLTVPSTAAFSIDAMTRFGEIHSDFDEARPNESGREKSVNARVGQGGPQVRIETRNGDIHIGKRG